jgi:hypothetical protein
MSSSPASSVPNTNTTSNSTADFQSDLAADRDGYFARLASRVFGSGDGFLATFADEQRLERLDGCTALEGDLGQCQRIRRKMEEALEDGAGGTGRGFWGRRGNNKSTNDTDEVDGTDTLTYVPSQSATKTRIARFYDWGEPDGGAKAPDAVASTNGAAAASPPSCHREAHSVWACRALAVGCADHLVPLRKCLRRTGSAAVHYEGGSGEALTEDGGDIGRGVDECVLEQQALAQCVNVKLDELDKRFRERQRAK